MLFIEVMQPILKHNASQSYYREKHKVLTLLRNHLVSLEYYSSNINSNLLSAHYMIQMLLSPKNVANIFSFSMLLIFSLHIFLKKH